MEYNDISNLNCIRPISMFVYASIPVHIDILIVSNFHQIIMSVTTVVNMKSDGNNKIIIDPTYNDFYGLGSFYFTKKPLTASSRSLKYESEAFSRKEKLYVLSRNADSP